MGYSRDAGFGDRGIVPVVAAILILGVVMAFFAVYYKAYVDSECTRAESELADRCADVLLRLQGEAENMVEGGSRTFPLRLTPSLPAWVPEMGSGASIWVEGWEA